MSDNALLFKGKSFKFQETVESLNGMTWFGPPGVTILWQPMNAAQALGNYSRILFQQNIIIMIIIMPSWITTGHATIAVS